MVPRILVDINKDAVHKVCSSYNIQYCSQEDLQDSSEGRRQISAI